MNDYFERLENQLAELTEQGTHLRAAPLEPRQSRRRWFGAIVPAVSVAVAIAVAAVVLISVHAAMSVQDGQPIPWCGRRTSPSRGSLHPEHRLRKRRMQAAADTRSDYSASRRRPSSPTRNADDVAPPSGAPREEGKDGSSHLVSQPQLVGSGDGCATFRVHQHRRHPERVRRNGQENTEHGALAFHPARLCQPLAQLHRATPRHKWRRLSLSEGLFNSLNEWRCTMQWTRQATVDGQNTIVLQPATTKG